MFWLGCFAGGLVTRNAIPDEIRLVIFLEHVVSRSDPVP